MILTCPECATRYFVPDDKVGPEGRTVKCSSCGNRWTAHGEPALELFVDAHEGATARNTPDPAFDEQPVSALPGEELPKVFRQKADTDRKVREAVTTGIVWAGMAVALMAMVGTAVVFRVHVVKLWPGSASAYASVGLPVNRLGLTIEKVHARAAKEDDHAALAVTGVIRNIRNEAVAAPPLRVTLKNKAGKVVARKVAEPAEPSDRQIPAGGVRHFSVMMLDPPTTAADLFVDFDLEHRAAPVAHQPQAKRPELRGSAAAEPVAVAPVAAAEAHPLPDSSPYALPKEGH